VRSFLHQHRFHNSGHRGHRLSLRQPTKPRQIPCLMRDGDDPTSPKIQVFKRQMLHALPSASSGERSFLSQFPVFSHGYNVIGNQQEHFENYWKWWERKKDNFAGSGACNRVRIIWPLNLKTWIFAKVDHHRALRQGIFCREWLGWRKEKKKTAGPGFGPEKIVVGKRCLFLRKEETGLHAPPH